MDGNLLGWQLGMAQVFGQAACPNNTPPSTKCTTAGMLSAWTCPQLTVSNGAPPASHMPTHLPSPHLDARPPPHFRGADFVLPPKILPKVIEPTVLMKPGGSPQGAWRVIEGIRCYEAGSPATGPPVVVLPDAFKLEEHTPATMQVRGKGIKGTHCLRACGVGGFVVEGAGSMLGLGEIGGAGRALGSRLCVLMPGQHNAGFVSHSCLYRK